MTKSQIKAELRRSACEDDMPWREVDEDVWGVVCDWHHGMYVLFSKPDDQRMFFLFLAEAL